jgi:TldD protein
MSEIISKAATILLEPVSLKEHSLESILGRAMGSSIDAADIYLQSSQNESWVLEDGIVKSGGFGISHGFGLRAISGEKTGFAYADNISLKALDEAAKSAKSIAQSGGEKSVRLRSVSGIKPLYPSDNPLVSLTDMQKIELLQQVDRHARKIDPRVKQVFVNLSGEYDVVLVMGSDGTFAADLRPLVHMGVRVIVEQNGRREKGGSGGGARSSYEHFTLENVACGYAESAVRQALLNLEAEAAPAGTMPVVLGPGWPAVLLHEAIGHGLEGDFNRKGSSAFSDSLGERVASDICTVVDDGTIAGRRGSLTVDDEGTIAERTVLIEKGILKAYMQDKHNASLMNMQSTGNGRRESYAHLPLPRMTNTYMLPGMSDPDEIIASVDKGIYAVDFAGGQVDITSGKFVFSTSEAYLIEDGKIKSPLKGVTLIGSGPEVLRQVSMVGNNLELDRGIGTCGKEGQSVPVGVGQPTIRVDELTVGGSQ